MIPKKVFVIAAWAFAQQISKSEKPAVAFLSADSFLFSQLPLRSAMENMAISQLNVMKSVT